MSLLAPSRARGRAGDGADFDEAKVIERHIGSGGQVAA
jgi:hypothetical protein